MMPTTPFPRTEVRPVSRPLRQFADAEDGGMIVLGLFFFTLMIMIGGMAVDLMRFENSRTELQQTLDRSVLAAASLKQQRDPADVVEDYFAKAGLADKLMDVDADPSLSSRIVAAVGETSVPTFFMHMLDVKDLSTTVGATAEESVSNIEISLVLDISGSMRNGDQIGRLKVAAKEFFATVLDGDAATTTSINVVPYAGMVNVGPTLFTRFGGTRVHNESSCIELNSTDYTNMSEPTGPRVQVAHFMNWTIDTATMNWGWCPTDNAAIQIAQNNIGKLNTFVDNIRLHDGTGTHTGMKYGLMLLNPAMRSTFAALSGTEVPPQFADRPLNWSTSVGSDVQKYLIVMTDGNITEQVRPRNVAFVDPDDDNLDNEQVQNGTTTQWINGNKVTVPVWVDDPDNVDGIDYPGWNGTNLTYRKELLNQPSGNRTGALSSASVNRDNFYRQCDLAKANGVTVYAIAFNATTQGKTEMTNCATSSAHYFSVTGVQISSAFAVIARNIRQLRLTQ
jgi:Flp pilus assembly protein TadG